MKKGFALTLAMVMMLTLVPFSMSFADDVPVLHVLAHTDVRQSPWGEMGMFKDAEAAAGVKIEWEEISSGWDEKKPILLASGDLPDIIFGGSLSDSDMVTNLDSFVDMTDLIAEYAPNIQKLYEDIPDAKASGTFFGGIYSLPLCTAYMPGSFNTLNINKVWLDRLGLEVPTTLDELEACLIAFRDNDANNNGDPNDEIPLDWPSAAHGHDIYALTGAYGVVDNGSMQMITIQDGKIGFLYETEAFYKITQRLRHWYEEGLITPEVYTNDYPASSALCSTGDYPRVGVSTGYSAPSRFSKFSDEYIPISPVASGEGQDVKWPFSRSGSHVIGHSAVITKSCKDPVSAIRFLNELFTDDFGIQEYYGSFDTGAVTKYDDGTYSIQLIEGYGSIDEMKWYIAPVNQCCGYFSADLQSRTTAPLELTDRTELEKRCYLAYRDDVKNIWPSFARFSEEQTEEMVYIQSDINNLVKQKMASWCVNGGIENEWDDFISSLKAMGLEDLRNIYQTVYDEYWGNN